MTTTDTRYASGTNSDLADRLHTLRRSMSRAGILARPEAEVKAEALAEAAAAQRVLGEQSRTGNGWAEHNAFADWLEDRAAAIANGTE